MKKSYVVLIVIFLVLIWGCFIFFSRKNVETNPSENYQVEKTLANNSSSENSNSESNHSFQNNVVVPEHIPVETEISSFSTQIHNKDNERQNNIEITCSSLNNTEITAGSTFSFCDTVGKSTSAKGYQEADVFTSDR